MIDQSVWKRSVRFDVPLKTPNAAHFSEQRCASTMSVFISLSLQIFRNPSPFKAAFSTRNVLWKIPWLARHIYFLLSFPRRPQINFRSVARPRPPTTLLVSTENNPWNVPWVARSTYSFIYLFPQRSKIHTTGFWSVAPPRPPKTPSR